jgi:hypothetical protein
MSNAVQSIDVDYVLEELAGIHDAFTIFIGHLDNQVEHAGELVRLSGAMSHQLKHLQALINQLGEQANKPADLRSFVS